jgi:hypothetical protein
VTTFGAKHSRSALPTEKPGRSASFAIGASTPGDRRYGTLVYKACGHDLRATQESMRHNLPVRTALYTFNDPTDTRSIVNALPTPAAWGPGA